MTRIETLQRSVVQANEQRIDSLKDKLTALTTLHREVTEQAAKLEQAPESLSAALTPLAEAMAALTAATKETLRLVEIGRAHVRTPVTNAHLVCRLLLDTKT